MESEVVPSKTWLTPGGRMVNRMNNGVIQYIHGAYFPPQGFWDKDQPDEFYIYVPYNDFNYEKQIDQEFALTIDWNKAVVAIIDALKNKRITIEDFESLEILDILVKCGIAVVEQRGISILPDFFLTRSSKDFINQEIIDITKTANPRKG